MPYQKISIGEHWVIFESGHDFKSPIKTSTFAIDTETLVFLDGKLQSQNAIFLKLRNCKTEEKRKRLRNEVWAWQCYDEFNGFFMTDDFYLFLDYIARGRFEFGWCYNATFDFSQIDYQILSNGKWSAHQKRTGKAYDKGQRWSYESIHNDTGSRYAYKLWVPHVSETDRHEYVHAFEFRDFMKLVGGGLRQVLIDLDVRDNDNSPVRKLEMDYQNVRPGELSQSEIQYCCNDVKGLYFAIKKFNATIEQKSQGESHIFGEETNVMTAGGFAKSELLRSLYPLEKNKKDRLRVFQTEHPLLPEQDSFFRKNKLYRGGISFVNPRYRGKLLTEKMMGRKMNRFDVNSEYPFAMASIRDLIGEPIKKSYDDYLAMKDKDDYECVLMLDSVEGKMRQGMVPLWYDPFRKDYVRTISEDGLHLIFQREIDELSHWYDFTFSCENVILFRKGDYVYRPFVLENYADKAKAKKEHNLVLQKVDKLKLNSAYGKLAERIVRNVGHYELSSETGAVHYVDDGEEVDEKSAMNVAIGSLVTSFARCYIMSKIREICGPNVTKNFVYIDTDSIHCYSDYAKADPLKLGELKLEAQCSVVKYLAPKTYVDVENIDSKGVIDVKDVEIHTKGISLGAVMSGFRKRKKLTLDHVNRQIAYGKKYIVLCAMNVKGGKVLVPVEKYLAKPEPKSDEKEFIVNGTGNAGFIER